MLFCSGDTVDGCAVGVSGVLTISSLGLSGTLVSMFVAGAAEVGICKVGVADCVEMILSGRED